MIMRHALFALCLQAIDNEDYDEAKRLKAGIDKLRAVGEWVWRLGLELGPAVTMWCKCAATVWAWGRAQRERTADKHRHISSVCS